MKNSNTKLLNDFEDKYLLGNKRKLIRYLLIGGISLTVVVFIIVVAVAVSKIKMEKIKIKIKIKIKKGERLNPQANAQK